MLQRPTPFAVPALLLRLVLGEFAGELLASRRVDAGRVLANGYRFRYLDLVAALHTVVHSTAGTSGSEPAGGKE